MGGEEVGFVSTLTPALSLKGEGINKRKRMNFLHSLYPGVIVVMGVAALRMGWDREAGILLALAFLLLIWFGLADLWEKSTNDNYSKAALASDRAKFAQSVATLSPIDKQILGIEWPELDIEFDGKPTICLRGTNILLTCFQKFIEDSTERDFASERLYNDDKFLQETLSMSRDAVRHQWHLAVAYLAERGFLTRDSAAGSHTYRWMKGGHKQMQRWYGGVNVRDYIGLEVME